MTATSNMISTPLAIVGYFLSAVGYLARLAEGIPRFGIMLGMMLATSGYLFLLLSKMRKLREEAEQVVVQKKEGFSEKEAKDEVIKNMGVMTSQTFEYVGFTVLFAFFGGILLFPSLTFKVRYYDPFAAAGYGMALLKSFVPYYIPYILLTLYYTFGSHIKLDEEGWVNKIQLVSRTLLAIYYGLSAAGIH